MPNSAFSLVHATGASRTPASPQRGPRRHHPSSPAHQGSGEEDDWRLPAFRQYRRAGKGGSATVVPRMVLVMGRSKIDDYVAQDDGGTTLDLGGCQVELTCLRCQTDPLVHIEEMGVAKLRRACERKSDVAKRVSWGYYKLEGSANDDWLQLAYYIGWM